VAGSGLRYCVFHTGPLGTPQRDGGSPGGHPPYGRFRRSDLREWDETQGHGDKRSFLKCDPARGKMLRVVVRDSDHQYVITAYYDRRFPCG